MRHIISIHKGNLNIIESTEKKGCSECQSSCQSACKTSCTVSNQVCQKENK
ncbi:MAG: six-cysteine ranthipeptide SCIFF [Tepidanaerobacteraceae bacterium]|nr:six-cysteine ranthipeptide SCIFF [Tepidanaerobacteraceae bacterium]